MSLVRPRSKMSTLLEQKTAIGLDNPSSIYISARMTFSLLDRVYKKYYGLMATNNIEKVIQTHQNLNYQLQLICKNELAPSQIGDYRRSLSIETSNLNKALIKWGEVGKFYRRITSLAKSNTEDGSKIDTLIASLFAKSNCFDLFENCQTVNIGDITIAHQANFKAICDMENCLMTHLDICHSGQLPEINKNRVNILFRRYIKLLREYLNYIEFHLYKLGKLKTIKLPAYIKWNTHLRGDIDLFYYGILPNYDSNEQNGNATYAPYHQHAALLIRSQLEEIVNLQTFELEVKTKRKKAWIDDTFIQYHRFLKERSAILSRLKFYNNLGLIDQLLFEAVRNLYKRASNTVHAARPVKLTDIWVMRTTLRHLHLNLQNYNWDLISENSIPHTLQEQKRVHAYYNWIKRDYKLNDDWADWFNIK